MAWMALLLFGGLGFVALVAAGLLGARRHSFQRQGLRGQGEVVANLSSRESDAEFDGLEERAAAVQKELRSVDPSVRETGR
jgi:hypothetical protein